MISCSPYVISRSTCSQGLNLPGITAKVSLTFFKSVSQFDNVLIVSQMLIIHETLSHISRKISLPNCFLVSVSQFTTVAVPVVVPVPVLDSGVCIRP